MMGGANVNDVNSDGLSLLHQAILRKDTPSCIFLMDNQADISKKLVAVCVEFYEVFSIIYFR